MAAVDTAARRPGWKGVVVSVHFPFHFHFISERSLSFSSLLFSFLSLPFPFSDQRTMPLMTTMVSLGIAWHHRPFPGVAFNAQQPT